MTTKKAITLSINDVHDILNHKKSETRLEIKPQPELINDKIRFKNNDFEKSDFVKTAPYQIGDLLYVKEPFAVGEIKPADYDEKLCQNTGVNHIIPKEYAISKGLDTTDVIWKPAAQMKRSDARLILEVVDIKFERLQDISEISAKSEGAERCFEGRHPLGGIVTYCDRDGFYDLGFKVRWANRANKHTPDNYSWNKNPYVWVISFKINNIINKI